MWFYCVICGQGIVPKYNTELLELFTLPEFAKKHETMYVAFFAIK